MPQQGGYLPEGLHIMTKYIITSNGQPVPNIQSFTTYNSAVLYIGMADMNNEWQVAEQADQLETDSSVGAQFIKTQNQLNEVEAELNALKAENARLQNQFDFVSAHVTSWSKRWNDMGEYLQASIDREEWSESLLEDDFWKHLADEFNLDLKQTEEIEVTVTVTYSGTVTLPKGTDLYDVEFDSAWHLTGEHLGETVAELTYDDIEIIRD